MPQFSAPGKAAIGSPTQLAALARSGVPDAGACGLVYVLAALQAVITGAATSASDYPKIQLGFDPFGIVPPTIPDDDWQEGDDADQDGFEVMFTLRRPAGATEFQPGQVAKQLRHELSEVGNSVVVVGGLAVGDAAKDSEWHGHVHVAQVSDALQVIERWRKVARVAAIQVRHLAVPASDLNFWTTSSDLEQISEFARAGAVVLIPTGDVPVSDDVIAAVKASPTSANIILVPPELVPAVSEGLNYPTDLILGPANAAAEALLLMVVSDQITAGNELVAARETANRLVTASSSITARNLPPTIHDAAASGLVVAAVPHLEPPDELAEARVECEELGAELVVIQRGDTNPTIDWATENVN